MATRDERRCIFCARAKGDPVNPSDPTSRRVILTREHLFPSTWQEKLAISILLDNAPIGEREHRKYGLDLEPKSSRPEPLFGVVVKPVCDYCNNGWMNDLDFAVEPWLIDPWANNHQLDVETFRRWATKVAVLRSYHENRRFAQPGDLTALYNGEDIAAWKIFVGRGMIPNHDHTFVGVGPILPATGGRMVGVTQVSWALGEILLVAIRPARDDDSRTGMVHLFRNENRRAGTLVVEVKHGAPKLPDLSGLTPLAPFAWSTIQWFYSTHPRSPVSRDIAQMERNIRTAVQNRGLPFRDV